MSRPSTELARQASRASITSSHYNDSSIRSNASSSGSYKRRSRILMKIIPFAREAPPTPPAADRSQRCGTFPRVRAKNAEPVEELAARFSDLTSDCLSPPLSASSTRCSSTPATSPELGLPELPTGRKSGSSGRRECRLKGASSRESVRSLFASPAKASPIELEWEKTLEDAASRASWQSSIEHRPRPHPASSSQRVTSAGQSTWPRAAGNPVHTSQDGLQLEHVFVDATGQWERGSYGALPSDIPMSVAGSQRGFSSRQSSVASRGEQGRFGTLPRVKTRRPSTTGSSMRGEPAQFELKPTASEAALQTASLGRSTGKPKRHIPDAASIWQMGRRRSSGVGLLATTGGSFSAGGSTRKMPTIPQGHSRETSHADIDEDPQSHPWLGIDPYAQPLANAEPSFARGYSITSEGGPGEYLPIRFYTRRESQDDIALLRRRSSSNHSATPEEEIGAPVFNLHPFARVKRPSVGRSLSSSQLMDRATNPDVPEAVTGSEAEDGFDEEGWCRRRSTFASLGPVMA